MGTTEKNEILDAHNSFRCMHMSPYLAWDNDIAKRAQQWASKGQYQMAPEKERLVRGRLVGQNVGLRGTTDDSVKKVVAGWYAEIKRTPNQRGSIDENSGSTSGMKAYAQVVWKKTTRVGCGVGPNRLMVCFYDPPGNVKGEYMWNVRSKGFYSESTCQKEAASKRPGTPRKLVAKYCGKTWKR